MIGQYRCCVLWLWFTFQAGNQCSVLHVIVSVLTLRAHLLTVIFCFISCRLCSDKTLLSIVSVLNISLFSEKTQGCWILTHLYSHTPKNNQMTIELFQGSFTGPRPFSKAFNHIQPKPIPTVFWAKSIHKLSSRFSLLLTVVGSHTHGRYMLKRFLRLIPVYLPTSICGPGLSPGARGGDPSLISRLCYGSGGECAVSQVWCRSGCCPPPRHVLPLDWAFGLPMRPHVLRNWFW